MGHCWLCSRVESHFSEGQGSINCVNSGLVRRASIYDKSPLIHFSFIMILMSETSGPALQGSDCLYFFIRLVQLTSERQLWVSEITRVYTRNGTMLSYEAIYSKHITCLVTRRVPPLVGVLTSPRVTPLLLTTRAGESTIVADIL